MIRFHLPLLWCAACGLGLWPGWGDLRAEDAGGGEGKQEEAKADPSEKQPEGQPPPKEKGAERDRYGRFRKPEKGTEKEQPKDQPPTQKEPPAPEGAQAKTEGQTQPAQESQKPPAPEAQVKQEGAAPAPEAAPKAEVAEVTGKREGEAPGEPELSDLYEEVDPNSQIEGAAGWAHNRLPRTELDNDVLPIPDRWRIGMPKNSLRAKGSLINPFGQNILKGDYPILGQNTFLNVIASSDTLVEGRSLPTPSGVTSVQGGSFGFFGSGEQLAVNQNFILSLELFGGETEFKPRDWEVRATPVFNINYLDVNELFAVNIDPSQGENRHDGQIAFQELFGEYHLYDLTPNYDFVAGRLGIQSFNLDHRGFLFADENLGARLFGTYEGNRIQFNLAAFKMLEKDTNSDLNTLFRFKDEHVFLGNVIRQDTFVKGYDIIGQLALSLEEETQHYNENGVLVRPAPIGGLRPHAVRAGYVGFGGNGHIGRLNLTHQFYQAFGQDTLNPIAGRETAINAQMLALEASLDVDWMRFRSSYFYASGDNDPLDGTATGFDAIFDNPDFAGGQFSYWVRQGIIPGNALTLLKSRLSLLPNLSTGKGEGNANFVNPGLQLFNIGYDADLLPHLKTILNASYLEFANTNALEVLLNVQSLSKRIGYDLSIGFQYRPLLNNNIILNAGVAGLVPLRGFQQLYESRDVRWHAFFGVTLTY